MKVSLEVNQYDIGVLTRKVSLEVKQYDIWVLTRNVSLGVNQSDIGVLMRKVSPMWHLSSHKKVSKDVKENDFRVLREKNVPWSKPIFHLSSRKKSVTKIYEIWVLKRNVSLEVN